MNSSDVNQHYYKATALPIKLEGNLTEIYRKMNDPVHQELFWTQFSIKKLESQEGKIILDFSRKGGRNDFH